MVPRGRLELPLLSETDFESAVSTDFTIWALQWYPEQDSNLHTVRRGILSALCLPVSPSGPGAFIKHTMAMDPVNIRDNQILYLLARYRIGILRFNLDISICEKPEHRYGSSLPRVESSAEPRHGRRVAAGHGPKAIAVFARRAAKLFLWRWAGRTSSVAHRLPLKQLNRNRCLTLAHTLVNNHHEHRTFDDPIGAGATD